MCRLRCSFSLATAAAAFAIMSGPAPALCAPASSPAADARLHGLSWLEGVWRGGSSKLETEERWTSSEGGMMFAVNRSFSGGRVVHFEFLRIAADAQGVALFAQPRGKPPTRFQKVAQTPGSVTFENLSHDFPQRIVYLRRGDALEVRAEGGDKVSRWRWTRVSPGM
ncbi:MAG: DUF6265 family protein [Myxococcota bacterium]